MRDVTVLYYTANSEDSNFEQKIRDNILKYIGDLPLVSVSQVPIDFGFNICVGKHTNCYPNEYRQIRIGLDAVKTKYVLSAEADFLYPPEYFQFDPTDRCRFYRYMPVWVLFVNDKSRYFYKGHSEGAQIMERDLLKDLIDESLDGLPMWNDFKRLDTMPVLKTDLNCVWGGEPAVTFKTRRGVSNKTYFKHDGGIQELPFWGNARELCRRML